MTKKNYYMVLDTETCGDYVFDIGYRVIDRNGDCVATGSYVVKEFVDNPQTLNMFTDRFTRDKIARYYYDLWKYKGMGGFVARDFATIRSVVNNWVRHYNCIICAYNIAFDLNHLEKTANYFGYDTFFDHDVKTLDIWHMAMSVLGTKNYIRFCMENDLLTKCGNIATGAEAMYRFIANDPAFVEEHTAYKDTLIESDIMVKCFKRKKHFETSTVGMCLHNKEWQRIQGLHKEMR